MLVHPFSLAKKMMLVLRKLIPRFILRVRRMITNVAKDGGNWESETGKRPQKEMEDISFLSNLQEDGTLVDVASLRNDVGYLSMETANPG